MRKNPRVATLVSILVAAAVLVLPATALAVATSPTSPVNLATPVDFGAAKAAPGATVVAGDARFEILGDGLIRLEYSPSGTFEDAPTVNAQNRRFAVPRYRVSRSGGWLTIATSQATLRYRLGSGPFGPDNTSLRARQRRHGHPAMGERVPVRPGGAMPAPPRWPAARTSRPTTPAIRASPDLSAASTRAAAPPPGACSARPPGRRWSRCATRTTSARWEARRRARST